MHKGHESGKARAMDKMRRSGEKKGLLERAVGDGNRLWCSTIFQESQLIVQRGPHVIPLPNSNNTNILVGCKTSLIQGRCIWLHNQILHCIGAALESEQMIMNNLPPHHHATAFVGEHEGKARLATSIPDTGWLGGACDRNMVADLDQRFSQLKSQQTTSDQTLC